MPAPIHSDPVPTTSPASAATTPTGQAAHIERLLNPGMTRIGQAPAGSYRTLVIVGAGRGGTSMCAGALHHLGVFMGSNAPAPTYEDLELYYAYQSGDWTRVQRVIKRYDREHLTWGFKLPCIVSSLKQFHELLRYPRYLFVFRDLAAIGQRSAISTGSDIVPSMREALANYLDILDFIESHSPVGLVCSYEKSLRLKEQFVSELIALVGPTAPIEEDGRRRATSFISELPTDYITTTCWAGDVGYVDSISADRIAGWAKHRDPRRLPELVLKIRGKDEVRFSPNQYRADIKEKRIHPTGMCGFMLELGGKHRLSAGDTVSVRFLDSGVELRNSPRSLDQES